MDNNFKFFLKLSKNNYCTCKCIIIVFYKCNFFFLYVTEILLDNIWFEKESLKLKFNDGTVGTAPFVWMRDNCQCSTCFDKVAQGRKSLLQDIELNVRPQSVEFTDYSVTVNWSDGHSSIFNGEWFHERSFTSKTRQEYESKYQIKKVIFIFQQVATCCH